MPATPATYRGRFAPSPTGPLHLGSLMTAVASYVDARHAQGEWLIRIEDLDPPREVPGASDSILATLDAHGLTSDGPILYQSQRLSDYHLLLQHLQQQQLAYPCNCPRQRVMANGGIYDGHCRQTPPPGTDQNAIRLKTHNLPKTHAGMNSHIRFDDLFQGVQTQQVDQEVGDFVIFRRDGLFAYQLAVVADDITQGITHIIRGADLLDNTGRQLWLYQLLQAPAPVYGHLPVIVNAEGQKLSKQTFAGAIDNHQASHNLTVALSLLNHPPPAELAGASPEELLGWASSHWQRQNIPACLTIAEPPIASGARH